MARNRPSCRRATRTQTLNQGGVPRPAERGCARACERVSHLGDDVALDGRVAARINDLRPSDAPMSLQHTQLGSRPGNRHRPTRWWTEPLSRADICGRSARRERRGGSGAHLAALDGGDGAGVALRLRAQGVAADLAEGRGLDHRCWSVSVAVCSACAGRAEQEQQQASEEMSVDGADGRNSE